MNKHRIYAIFVIAAAMVVLGATGLHASYSHSEVKTSDITLDGAKALVVEGVNGIIHLSGEKGRESILLEVTKIVNADDEDEARGIADQIKINVDRKGEILRIEVVYPKNYRVKRNLLTFLVNRHPKMATELKILVPEGLETVVTAASGKIGIHQLEAPAKATLASGEIDIMDITGPVNASLSSGKINGEHIKGDIDFKVSSGMITVKDVTGNAIAGLSSGKVELSDIDGDLDCSIEYGKVVVEGVKDVVYKGISAHAKFVDVRGLIDASTASGSISFRVNPDDIVSYKVIASSGDISLRFLEVVKAGFILKAGTTSGDISIQLPIDIKNVGRNNISGVIRDGTGKIFLETASGDISVAEPEE